MSSHNFISLVLFFSNINIPKSNPTPTQHLSTCNNIFLQYTYTRGQQLPPNLIDSNPKHQPYKFQSTIYIQNNGLKELNSWRVFVGFQNGELLVSTSNAILLDGSPLPANVSNGTIFTGYPVANLKTAIETAGDLTRMSV